MEGDSMHEKWIIARVIKENEPGNDFARVLLPPYYYGLPEEPDEHDESTRGVVVIEWEEADDSW